MNATETALNWAAGIESHTDGTAYAVDATKVEATVDIEDVDKNDIKDEDTETSYNTDGDKEVKSSDTRSVTNEDFDVSVSSAGAGKTIDATGVDEVTGCPRRYVISGFDASNNPAREPEDNAKECVILLQNGSLKEVGVNGVTAEDLLKVVEEVYVCYQESKFACEENEVVLGHLRAAQVAMASRFERRAKEGTEGTHEGN